jgi:hypothetical protein
MPTLMVTIPRLPWVKLTLKLMTPQSPLEGTSSIT